MQARPAEAESYIDQVNIRRVRDRELVIPVVVGSVAFYLGKKATDTFTHRWTVFLRAPDNSDLSHIIQKVTFQLHHSFTEANREISTQPFQVTENGWGEFTVGVKVSFTADAKLPDVDLFHPLKLYGDEKSAEQGLPVVSETYDELVLVDPTWEVWQRCSGVQPKPAPYADWMAHVLHHSGDTELQKVLAARQRIALMTHALKVQGAAV